MKNSIFLLTIGMALSMLSFCANAQSNPGFVTDIGIDETQLQLEITESPVVFVLTENQSSVTAYVVSDSFAEALQLVMAIDPRIDPFLFSAQYSTETNCCRELPSLYSIDIIGAQFEEISQIEDADCCRELPYFYKPELRDESYNDLSHAPNDCCRDIIIPLSTDLKLAIFDSKSQAGTADLPPVLIRKNSLVRRSKPSNPPNLYGSINLSNPKYRYRHAGI